MSKTITYPYQAQCPYLNDIHSISINYSEIQMCCYSKSPYKKSNYSCDKSDDCTFKDRYGRCPVYLKAPSDPL